jgi:hypothetical protein
MREDGSNLESAIAAMNSILVRLRPDPIGNLQVILCWVCEQLKCKAAVYAWIEKDTGKVDIRGTHNLDLSLSSAWEITCGICNRIIYAGYKEPLCTFSLQELSQVVSIQTCEGFAFQSIIGYPINLNSARGAAIAVMDEQALSFNEEERLLVAFSGMLLWIEDSRLHRAEASGEWKTISKKLTPTEARVADSVRQGKANKEIAKNLSLSIRAVEFHRYNIRKKLGIRKAKINLQRYLDVNG